MRVSCPSQNLSIWPKTYPFFPGGHSTLGYAPCVTKKTLLFFARFHRKTPYFTDFHPMTPGFNKLLVTERPWHIFVTQRPLIYAFNDKFDEMLRNFWPFWPWQPLFFYAFQWKTPYFCALCHWKTPFLTQFVTERSLHLRCLVALVRHFHMWVPPPGLFSSFARFCTPKRCTRVHCLVLKNNPNYVNFSGRNDQPMIVLSGDWLTDWLIHRRYVN